MPLPSDLQLINQKQSSEFRCKNFQNLSPEPIKCHHVADYARVKTPLGNCKQMGSKAEGHSTERELMEVG